MTLQIQRRFAFLALVILTGPVSAQTPVPTTRTTVATGSVDTRQAVTGVVVRDGRVGLIGTDRSIIVNWTAAGASEIFTSETGIKIAVRDGRIAELAAPKGSLGIYKYDGALTQELKIAPTSMEIGGLKAGSTLEIVKIPVRSTAIARDGSLRLQAADGSAYTIPNGDYIATDGRKSIAMRDGRAVQFLLPGTAQRTRDVNDQPISVATPIRQ